MSDPFEPPQATPPPGGGAPAPGPAPAPAPGAGPTPGVTPDPHNPGYGYDPNYASYRYWVMLGGYSQGPYGLPELQAMVRNRGAGPDTPAAAEGTESWTTLQFVPGLYSDKDFTTAVILAVLLGSLGIDRFYLGYTALGILKLVTFGGCGIWALIDLILIATRNLGDVHGRPLR